MSLFERVRRVARAEANYAKSQVSQSITPEQEMERAISQMRSDVIAIQIAISRSPESQAQFLKRRLSLLELQLSKAEAISDELLRRMRKAKEQLQNKANPSKSLFERMEEKVLEIEACAEAADENQLSPQIDEELEAMLKHLDSL